MHGISIVSLFFQQLLKKKKKICSIKFKALVVCGRLGCDIVADGFCVNHEIMDMPQGVKTIEYKTVMHKVLPKMKTDHRLLFFSFKRKTDP